MLTALSHMQHLHLQIPLRITTHFYKIPQQDSSSQNIYATRDVAALR